MSLINARFTGGILVLGQWAKSVPPPIGDANSVSYRRFVIVAAIKIWPQSAQHFWTPRNGDRLKRNTRVYHNR